MNYSNSNLKDEFTQGIDGTRLDYVYTKGLQSYNGRDLNEFFCAEGGFKDKTTRAFIGQRVFSHLDGEGNEEDYYNLFGLDAKSRERRNARRDLRAKSKAEARGLKAQGQLQKNLSKRDQAKAQQMSAKASEKGVAGDIALANALAKDTPSGGSEKGMSTGAKIGIAVGVVVVLGIIGFVVYKKMKKGGK